MVFKNYSFMFFFIELCIPDSSNVFYAMNSSMKEYHFALLEDGSQIKPAM